MSEEALIVLVNFEIESGILMRLINEELVNKLGDTNVSVDYIDEIVEDLLPGIRRIILLEISLWKVGNTNSPLELAKCRRFFNFYLTFY